MGAALRECCCKAGHSVTVWNRSPDAMKALAAQGATAARTPAETMQGEVLFSMLASDQAMQDIGLDTDLLEKAAKDLHPCESGHHFSGLRARDLAAAHEAAGWAMSRPPSSPAPKLRRKAWPW